MFEVRSSCLFRLHIRPLLFRSVRHYLYDLVYHVSFQVHKKWIGATANYVVIMTPMEGRCVVRHGSHDANDVGELVDAVGSASRLKHILGKVIDLVGHRVVGIEECVNMPPRVLDRVHMSPSTNINETEHVVDGYACLAGRFEVPVLRPALIAHRTTLNKTHILEELNTNVGVAAHECEKELISSAVWRPASRSRTSLKERTAWN